MKAKNKKKREDNPNPCLTTGGRKNIVKEPFLLAKATSQKRLAVIAPLKHNNHIVVSPTQSSEAKVSRGA